MKSLDLQIRNSIGTRPPEQTVDDSVRSSLESLSNQLDVLESWDSIHSISMSAFVNTNVLQFVDYDGHVSATVVPHSFEIAGAAHD